MIFTRGAGCYGINGADTVTYDAALLSQAVGKPVRVQLTRRDEMAWENYGYPVVADERAGLDAQGNIIAWDHEAWGGVRGNRPGTDTPGNVVTGFLAGFLPEAIRAGIAGSGAQGIQQSRECRAVLRDGMCRRQVRRNRNGEGRAGGDAQRGLAIFHGATAIS